MVLVGAMELERARLISVCGAGGKTSLIFSLAKEYVSLGEKVLITTTTKMAEIESRGRFPSIEAKGADEILDFVDSRFAGPGAIIAYSGLSANGEKLIGYPPEFVDSIARTGSFDRILVEADGSRGKPLKAPNNHEPVFPESSDTVIIVAGLNGVGQVLHEDNLFRADIWARLTGLQAGDKVTSHSVAQMLSLQEGMARGCPARARRIVFLNRADSQKNSCKAQKIMRALATLASDRSIHLVAGWLLPDPGIAVISSGQV